MIRMSVDTDRQSAVALDEDTAEPTTNIGVPGLWLIKPAEDTARIGRILTHAHRIREIWDIEAAPNRALFFTRQFAHPYNMLFDVYNGQGLIGFIYTVPGWYSIVTFAAWGKNAMRAHGLWTVAARIATHTYDLHVIHGFVAPNNTLSRRAAERCNMRFRGLTDRCIWYTGASWPLAWYEIDRETLLADEEAR